MHRGYVKIWRKTTESGLLLIPNTLSLFLHLLFTAAHTKTKYPTSHGAIDLDRGQGLCAIRPLAEKLNQGVKQIRVSLDKLEKLEIVALNKTHLWTVYTIVNYDKYQDSPEIEAQAMAQVGHTLGTDGAREGHARGTRGAQEEELKHLKNTEELKNEKKESKPSARGSRLPTDWVLTKELGEWAMREFPNLTADDVRASADCFRDFWIGKPGQSGVKTDWAATWRNWVRREAKNVRKPASGKPDDDQVREAARRRLFGEQNA